MYLYRKEKEYQQALADQIAEKNRLKAREQSRADEEKRRELELYVKKEYRGPVPDYIIEKISPPKPKSRPRRGEDEDDDEDLEERLLHLEERRRRNDRGRVQKKAKDQDRDIEVDIEVEDDRSHRRRQAPGDYDELLALCDELRAQQRELKGEVRRQAQIIEELRKKPAPANPRTAAPNQTRPPFAGKESLTRSKSVQQSTRPTRPAQVKVAFGGNPQSRRFEAPPPRPTVNKSSAPVKTSLAGAGAAALRGRVRGEPAVVTYDEESVSSRSVVRRGAGGEPLRGQSEYLRIGGDEVDVISGDQLDRLLIQAKGIKKSNY